MSTPGETVRAWREERGWSRERLARAVECSVGTLRNFEKNESSPTLDTVTRIADALELSAEQRAQLLGGGAEPA